MNWKNMIRKCKHIALILLVLGVISSQAVAQTPFEQLTQKFEHGRVFKAQFKHHYKDAYTGDEATRSGDIWIAKREYKIETKDQRVAVNGKLSHVYDLEKARVIISNYVPEDDDFAPSRILNGIDSTYTIKEQKKTSQGYFIELDSDDPFASFQQVQISLDRQGIPTKIFVRDPADNLITTRFSNGRFMARRAAMFELAYPDSANIIDMRQ